MRNAAGKFIRYSKADWTFPGVNITIPAGGADWSAFNLTNLPGEKTYPIVTTSILVTNLDLTGRGEHLLKHLCDLHIASGMSCSQHSTPCVCIPHDTYLGLFSVNGHWIGLWPCLNGKIKED